MAQTNIGVLQAILELKNQMSPELKKATRDLQATGQQIAAAGRALLPVSAGITAAGAVSLKFASDFDDAMTRSTAIMGDLGTETSEQFDAMRDSMEKTAREVAKTTTFSAKEAAESYFFLASAGLNAKASVGALPKVAQFAQAGMFGMALATDLLTDAQSALGLSSGNASITLRNMARVADVLVKANTLANASVQQFSEALTNKAANAMDQLNISVESGVAVLSTWADQGVKGAAAGERFNIVTRDLQTAANKNAVEFERFGIAVFDQAGSFRSLGDIIADLEGALAGMSHEQQLATLHTLEFTDRSIAATRSLIGASEKIREYERALREAAGTTQDVANKQLQSFREQLSLLWSRIKDIGIALGQELIPMVLGAASAVSPLITAAEKVVDVFSRLPMPLKVVAVGLAGLIAAIPVLITLVGSAVVAFGALAVSSQALGFASVTAGLVAIKGALVGAAAAAGAAIAPYVALAALIAGVGAAAFKLGSALDDLAIEYRGHADAVDQAIREQGRFKAGVSLLPELFAQASHALKSSASLARDFAKSLTATKGEMDEVQESAKETGIVLSTLGGFIELAQQKTEELFEQFFLLGKEIKSQAELGAIQANKALAIARAYAEQAREAGNAVPEIKSLADAQRFLSERTKQALEQQKEALQQQAENLRQSVAAMLDAKDKTDLLARASSLAGVKIEDEAKALEVLRQAAARAASEDIGKLVVSLGTSDIQAEAQKYVSALQQIQDSGKSLSLEGLDSVSGAIAKLESEGLKPLAKTIRELIPDATLLAKGQRDAAAAAAEHAQRAQSLATSLGTAGLRGQMESMRGALLLVLESGDRLSEQGFSQLSSMIEELEANGLHIPPLFEAMRDEFLATDIIVNQAANRFLGLKAILPAVATGIDRASQAQKDAAKTASAYELALAQVAGQMGGSVGQVANMTIAMLEHNRTLGDGEKAFSKAQIGSALMASAFAAAGDAIGGTGGEILTSVSNIASAFATGGIVGAAIAGIGEGIKWLGKLFKPKWKKIAEEGARLFGKAFSEELSRELVKSQKALGSLQNAMAANIGTIVEEVGVTAENLDQTMRSVHILIGMVENGTLDWKDAVGQLDKAFGPVMEQLIAMGTEGVFRLGRLIERMRELGKVSVEAQAFVQEKASVAVEAMTGFFENLAKQEELTAEQARNMVDVVATAFQAAIAAGGGLLGAVQQLGPAFGEVIQKLRGVLGDDNALLNQVSRFYNFVSNNQEQLSAIASLGTAFKELASIGLINAANIGDFAGTFKAEFDKILGSTEAQTAALAAMGPQIGLLLESYRELGMQVPPWLEEMAGKAKEAGANLTPPEDAIDVFRDIRDMLGELVDALKGVGDEARRAGGALAGMGGGGVPHFDDDFIPGFQRGGFVPETYPHGRIVRVAEPGTGGELITPRRGGRVPGGEGGGAGGGGVTIQRQEIVIDLRGSMTLGNGREISEALAPHIREAIEKNAGGVEETIIKVLE